MRSGGGQWRLLFTGHGSGAWNMAVDEAMMLLHAQGKIPPTIRFYQWEPPAVSLGYFQSWQKEIDREACRRLSIDVVRRPTGGRAVLHHHEVTYSVVIRQELLPGSILETYRQLSQGLLAGFVFLGVQAEMASLEKDRLRDGLPGRAAGAACFDSPSWYELLVEGRKVVGSAQVRKQETILQHGSILLDLDVDLLMEVLAFPSPAVRTRTRRVLAGKAGSLRDYLGKEATFERVSQAMAQGFAKALGIELIPADLQDEEKKLAEELAREKYAADWWLERA